MSTADNNESTKRSISDHQSSINTLIPIERTIIRLVACIKTFIEMRAYSGYGKIPGTVVEIIFRRVMIYDRFVHHRLKTRGEIRAAVKESRLAEKLPEIIKRGSSGP